MAALELPYVNLADALAVCLLMRRQGDRRFERAAVRRLARVSLERPGVTLEELREAAGALMELPAAQARERLANLGKRLDLAGVGRVLAISR